jgi:nitrite reductase (NADH) small subunit
MIRACAVDDVPAGEGRVVVIDGVRVAIFRAGGGWRAVDAACPHRGGPLADGIVADASVICPLHQRRFSLDTGEPLGHDCPALTVHRVEVRGTDLYVSVAMPAALPRAA